MGIAINLLKAPHVGIRELKEGLSAFLKKSSPVVVTDRGEPTNVILPYEDVVELLDIIEEINDPDTRSLVAEGRQAIKAGKEGVPVFPAAKVKNSRK